MAAGRDGRAGRFHLFRGMVPLALALLLSASALRAQTPTISFRHLSSEEGLPQSSVTSILQDRQGFLWFGTQGGLSRYDGYGFVVYKHERFDEGSLAGDWIRVLVEDDAGNLWVGTDGGLSRWDPEGGRFTSYRHDPEKPASLAGDRVWAIHQDRLGALWIGTATSGLDRFDPATGDFEHFRHDPSDPTTLSDDRIRAIHEDRMGNLWIGTEGGLNVFQRGAGSFTRIQHDPAQDLSLADNGVKAILEDHTGALWIGTHSGLDRLDRATLMSTHFQVSTSDLAGSGDVDALFEDSDGRLWVGTVSGLLLFDGDRERFTRFLHDPVDPASISSDHVISIYQDSGGVVWFGTLDAGVNKWDPATWSFAHYKRTGADSQGLSSDVVMAFSEDTAANLWIGTLGGGVNRLERSSGRITHFRHDPGDPSSLSDDRVTSLLHDREGNLWLGTLAGGLNRFDAGSGTFSRYDPGRPGSLVSSGVMSLLEDAGGTLWVGTFGAGLARFDGRGARGFTYFRHREGDETSLSNDRVTSLVEGAGGSLWVGTAAGGLDLFDPESGVFRSFRNDPERRDSLSSDSVSALHADGSGGLWIGTQGAGFDRLQSFAGGEAVFENFSEQDGLPDNTVHGIRSDARGRLWISTNDGLSRFDPKTRAFKNFDASHGLQSNEFVIGSHYSNADGEMFFGGVNGFNVFHPDRLVSNTTVPPIVLTSFSKFGQPVPLDSEISHLDAVELSHSDKVVAFEFAALDFTAPTKNRYAYRVEGETEDWIDLGHYRQATLMNLGAGRYTLQVKASNNDGVWNEDGLELQITVRPAPWRTWWAYSLYAAALVSVATVYRRGQRRRRERQRALEWAQEETELARRARQAAEEAARAKGDFLANLSHEIRTPMNGVLGMTSLVLDSELTPQQRDQLETVRVSGEALLGLLNDILDFSKIESRKLEVERAPFDLRQCVEEALALMAPTAANKGLDLGYWIEEGTPEMVIGDVTRTRQILVNLLSNGIKFTETGGVSVRLESRQVGDRLEIQIAVKDTGIGIPTDKLDRLFQAFSQVDASTTRRFGGTGLGLAICKQLAELMGGNIWVDSVEGEGSTFQFTILCQVAAGPDRSHFYVAHPELDGRRLLIVERTATAHLLRRFARLWGMESVTVSTAEEALEKLCGGGVFDLAVLDWETTDGELELSQVLDACEARRLPLILLTHVGAAVDKALESRLAAVLARPLKLEQLQQALATSGTPDAGAAAPALAASEDASTPGVPPPAAGKALRILLADDQQVNQKVIMMMIETLGYRADAVTNGREVLEALGREPYDVVLMDKQMPEMNGPEAARRIRLEMPEEDRPQVIALTGDGPFGLEEDFDGYLGKPVGLGALREILEQAESSLPDVSAEEPEPVTVKGGGGEQLAADHPLRILVAEDNPTNQKVTLLMLENLGYSADVVTNGVEAVEAFESSGYDVVLMDVQMPEMDGCQASKQLRRELAQEGQPYIVAITAHAIKGDRERYLEAGMDDYVSKPIRRDELTAALRRAVESRLPAEDIAV